MKSASSDEKWMRRALVLARRGSGRVHPNPLVGCVLVKGNRVLAEGYHTAFGRDHAEVEALRRAGTKARGATAYVNLEPCSHWGKTPPCADALIRYGVKRVVAAMSDPNPRVAGQGFRRLRQQGIGVSIGLLETEAQDLNRAFTTWVREQRPYVTMKVAASLDGKIATAGGESQWITGEKARTAGHALRSEADAIAVGIETVLHDNPRLTAHGKGRDPKKVIFDTRLRLPLQARLLKLPHSVMLFTTVRAPHNKRRALEKKGVSVYVLPADRSGRPALPEALRVLAREGIAHLLVEGGGTVHAAFLEAGLVDELVWFTAPIILGGEKAKNAVGGRGAKRLTDAWRVRDLKMELIGDDVCFRGTINRVHRHH